jgi:hypothetical protein
VFRSSLAKILIVMLFLKIIFIMDSHDFFIPQFFLPSFRPSPKLSQHLRTLRVTPVCRHTQVENRCFSRINVLSCVRVTIDGVLDNWIY